MFFENKSKASASTDTLAEPCYFTKHHVEFYVLPIGKNLYTINNSYTEDILVVEVQPTCDEIFVKNLYGELVMIGKFQNSEILWGADSDFSLGVTSSNKVSDKCSKLKYFLNSDDDGLLTVHGPFAPQKSINVVQKFFNDKPLLKTCWDKTALSTQRLTKTDLETSSKALITMAVFQFGLSMYFSTQCLQSINFKYLSLPFYKTNCLSALYDLSHVVLQRNRIIGMHTYYHYIEEFSSQGYRKLVLVLEVEQDGVLRVGDENRNLQFCAKNINVDGTVTVGLNAMINFGFVDSSGTILDREEQEIMWVRFLEEVSGMVKFDIYDEADLCVCKVYTGHAGIHIDMKIDLPLNRKALLIAQVFKVAYRTYVFNSLESDLLECADYTDFLPYPYQSKYEQPKKFLFDFAEELVTDSLEFCQLSLTKTGHNHKKGVSYFEVYNCSSLTGTPLLVFNVIEMNNNVMATAFDLCTHPLFSVYGIWDNDKDLIICQGQVVAMKRNDLFYGQDGNAVWEERKKKFKSTYQLYNMKSTSNKHNHCFAELSGSDKEVFIKLKSIDATNSESVALLLAYALKLGYNEYGIHKNLVRTSANV